MTNRPNFWDAPLELDERELVITRGAMRAHDMTATIGLVSVGIAVAALFVSGKGLNAVAGMIYFLMGPLHGLHGWRVGSRVVKLRPNE